MAHATPGEKRTIQVDVSEFVRTRDALSTAYMSLSASIDRAVKAYIDHTNVVLAGDAALNISYLTQPFNAITVAQMALAQGGDLSSAITPAPAAEPEVGGKKKRNYKPRDPNAPKRPLTAYFRYLQETRPALATEMAKDRNGTASKPGDLTKEATERWNRMTTDEQQPYKEAYQRALKDYEKEVAAYKGEVETAASPGAAEEEDATPAAPVASMAVAAKEDSDTSSDDDESSSDDDEEPAMPPPPPPEPKKTPKKKSKAAPAAAAVAPSPVPATPQFSSINPSVPVPASSSSPEVSKKRKAETATTAAEPEKKKRGRKTKAEKDAEEAAAAVPNAKPVVAESDASSSKKEKKKKKRKSEA